MGWTRRSYDALYEWGDKARRPWVKKMLLADGLADVVARLEASKTLGEWYKITHEAVAAVGPGAVEASAVQAEIELDAAAKALGRKGGLVKSARKAATSRANGAKGGRPRKPLAYEVMGSRHGTGTMYATTLREAIRLARMERHDGWPVWVRRMADDAQCWPAAR